MSATNLTKNLKLSQFVASDKPSWLGDVNGDNKKIDDGYGVLAGEISKANDTASSAKSQSDANTQTLTNVNSELEDYGNRITALEAGGGTEQLEQRVNTLSTDVEALQTRADTFEGDISQNGTDITTLKDRVDTIEPKVNANTNSITSLTSKTNTHSQTIQDLTANVSLVTTKANKADTNASSSLRIANEALNKANANTTTISSLSSKIDNFTPSTFGAINLTSNSQNFESTNGFILINNDSNFCYMLMPISLIGNITLNLNTPVLIGTIELNGILPSSMGKQMAWNDTKVNISSAPNLIITATKNTDATTISLYLKSVTGTHALTTSPTITPVFSFNLY